MRLVRLSFLSVLPLLASAALVLVPVGAAGANASLVQLSSDPYVGGGSQHATEVEPDVTSAGATLVAAFQAGRFYSGGGSTNIGWATSTDAGTTWSNGLLTGITTAAGGSYARVSDPSVAYDSAHGVWLISSLPIAGSTCCGAAVVVSRSSDGRTWGQPVSIAVTGSGNAGSNLDKDWVACDDTPTSQYYGHCYAEWDDYGNGDLIKVSTSTDGGLTWSTAKQPANNATGLAAEPVVQPNGTVVMAMDNGNFTSIIAFVSTDGGATWSATRTVASIHAHTEAGSLRSQAMPSVAIDGGGNVYVVWQDCRFRRSCRENDMVMSTSNDGVTWSAVARIPIDARSSSVDHFLPGVAADPATSGVAAHLGLVYYDYPSTKCSTSTCHLDVGYVSSGDGGATWTAPQQLAGPLTNTWLASTDMGYMVGDYIAAAVSNGAVHPVFALAQPPTGTTLDEFIATTASGLATAAGSSPRRAVTGPILITGPASPPPPQPEPPAHA